MPTQFFDLTGKTSIVTGGNGGIGFGIAKGLLEAGSNVVLAARDEAKTRSAVRELNGCGGTVVGVKVDVSDELSVESMVETAIEKFGKIDVLVNNAGITVRKQPQEYSLKEWNDVINVNLTGTFLCSRHVYPNMVRSGAGKIINIGSMTSVFGSDWVASYSASKGGVVQLTKSLAISWASHNIQVNAILPGWIHTDLTATIREQFPDRYRSITSRIPQGRWAEPYELAGTAVFLSSPASDYVTGVAIPVDGGYIAY